MTDEYLAEIGARYGYGDVTPNVQRALRRGWERGADLVNLGFGWEEAQANARDVAAGRVRDCLDAPDEASLAELIAAGDVEDSEAARRAYRHGWQIGWADALAWVE